jgi:2-polyprenyl-3-methyl-5-hydroxy-6-metoxy-1,4-benzoquinol methylase
MNIIDLGDSVKWQDTDKRKVMDIRKKVVSNVPFPPGLILEIGCGAGNFFEHISSFNFDYIGIDLDSNQINKAKDKFSKGEFICGNIFDFENLLKSCTTIVSFQVFEHIENDFELFNKIETGKNIIFSVPNFPYRSEFPDGHKRYYELDGWINRYNNIIDIDEVWIVKHYKKQRKIFIFQCTKV